MAIDRRGLPDRALAMEAGPGARGYIHGLLFAKELLDEAIYSIERGFADKQIAETKLGALRYLRLKVEEELNAAYEDFEDIEEESDVSGSGFAADNKDRCDNGGGANGGDDPGHAAYWADGAR